jgi:hypothetical protein
MRRILILALLLTGCSSIPQWADQPAPTEELRPEEVAVVTALLTDPSVEQGWGAPLLALLLDESARSGVSFFATFIGPDGEYCPPESLIASLRAASAIPRRLPASGNYNTSLKLHSWRAFWRTFFSKDEHLFSARYGSFVNVIAVSRPAFSASRNEALIGIYQISPRTGCSLGYVAYLERRAGQWYVLATGDHVIS